VPGPERGRHANQPTNIPFAGWKDIVWRVIGRVGRDRVALVAAGTAFYLLLALFPALAALVSIYGLVADPADVASHLEFLGDVLPANAFDIIEEQLTRLGDQDTGALGFGFLLGLAAALWSTNNGIKALVQAMNVAYREDESRGFVKLTLLTLGTTVGAMVVAVVLVAAVGLVPAAISSLGLAEVTETLIRVLRWPMLIVVCGAVISLVYRYAPSRALAKWHWVTWGGAFATIGWILASLLFSWYLSNLASYNETYGSLGAVIGMMLWMWLLMQILIIGATLDAEMEHQTERDATVGPEKPMGERGAVVADSLGRSLAEKSKES